MRHLHLLWLIAVSFSCTFLPYPAAATQKPIPTYQSHLSNLQNYAKTVGIQIIDLPSGRTVWGYKSNIPLVPASLVKILTSYAALKNLGPFYHFETSVSALSKPQNGAVEGDVWIKSEGDIYLVGEKLWDLANRLRQSGIRTIKGGICIDNSFFQPMTEQICLDGKCGSPYNPLIAGTSVDFNTISVALLPGDKAGSPVRVEFFPPGDYAKVINQATTVGAKTKSRLKLVSLGMNDQGQEKFQLSGKIPDRSNRTYNYTFNVHDPTSFAAYCFRSAFEQAGIEVKSKAVKLSTMPPGTIRLIEYSSPPLGDMLYGLNRYSNNFMAEMLLRTLGGSVLSPPGTAGKGISVIQQTLRQLGIPEREVSLDSGSGLSRNCQVSPQAFCRVLASAYNDFSIAPEFLSSLAMNSEEGTLRKRMRESEATVRGKTGTLRNVCGFAGYVSYPGKGVYAVTVLLNDVQNLWEAKKALYEFIEQIPMIEP